MSATVTALPGARPRKNSESVPFPDDFALTPELRRWAADRGVNKLYERFEHFEDLARAKGYKYLDWAAAFRNACRHDWAKLGAPVPPVRCVRCHQPARSGHTMRRDGPVCNGCDK